MVTCKTVISSKFKRVTINSNRVYKTDDKMNRISKINVLGLLLIMFVEISSFGAQLMATDDTQTIHGNVTDKVSGKPVGFCSVMLMDAKQYNAIADSLGHFSIPNVPIGRHTIKITYVGYKPYIYKDLQMNLSDETELNVRISEDVQSVGEVVIGRNVNKQIPLNEMAAVGARLFSIDETNRYAGGMGDPARMASSFSGVSTNGTSNGISIHGNSPDLMTWRMDGIEIPSPNHFADITTLGGGGLSSLSMYCLDNSDFMTSAFPAEYGNAVSGVFDLKLKSGNNDKYEHSFKTGILGLEASSEGPISRTAGSSYIVNYRYSFFGLVEKLGLVDMQGNKMEYQDINFKINLPTKHCGRFSVFGTGLIDDFAGENNDRSDWEYAGDEFAATSKQYMFVGGIGNVLDICKGGSLHTTVAYTVNKDDVKEKYYDDSMVKQPYAGMSHTFTNIISSISYQQNFGSGFLMKVGYTNTHLIYDMDMSKSENKGQPLECIYTGNGNTNHIESYISNKWFINKKLSMDFGINYNYLTLNKKYTLEPRVGWNLDVNNKLSLALGYGMHSKMEKTDVYFVKINNQYVNRQLGFTKAHHAMFSMSYKLSDNSLLKIEPFYQWLYNVPVEENGSYSVINRELFYVDKALVNEGESRNYGVDLTLERYMKDGYYYMVTGSFFNSRYCGGDKVWRNTRYNRHFVVNMLGGKDWKMGSRKQNVLSANAKITFQGGEHISPVDVDATLADPDFETQYDESKAFSNQFDPQIFFDFSVSYKIKKTHTYREFGVEWLNATATNGYNDYSYDIKDKKVEKTSFALSIPNIYYKVTF